MKKYKLFIIALASLLLISAGCSTDKDVKANLGEEFSLKSGQVAVISDENLKIEFVEVTGDSRCPKGVTCIWAGEVTAKVAIKTGNSLDELLLTEPGLTNFPPEQSFHGYKLAYHIEPYPQAGAEIAEDEYRLHLKISK
jgi:hypothetical protein